MEPKKLISYSTSRSGGMNGGFSSASICETEDGRCRVELVEKLTHNQPTKHVRFFAPGLLDKLSLLCGEYGVAQWTDLPDSPIVMQDGPREQDCFTFADGTKIVLCTEKLYPTGSRAFFGELKRLIDEAREYGVEVETEEESPSLAMGMMGFQLQMGGIAPESAEKTDDASQWAKFCTECGTKFSGTQKFCAACGAKRQKR